jgi:hypothetical protein
MIKNEREYKFTQELVGEFEKSLVAIERDEARKKMTLADGNLLEVHYNVISIN